MLIHSKTEFIKFSKKSKKEETKRNNLLIGNYKIPNVNCVKCLRMYLDCTLNFQEELKHVSRKLATGIKTIKRISRPFPEQTRPLLLSTLVISHLQYSGLLLSSSKKNCLITLEKQLSWAVKTCFNRKKYKSSSDLKLKHQILPIKFLLEYKELNDFMKFSSNRLPNFKNYTFLYQIYATASEPKNFASITK